MTQSFSTMTQLSLILLASVSLGLMSCSSKPVPPPPAKVVVPEPPPVAPPTMDAPAPEHKTSWSYDGLTGPQAWGQLSPKFATCDNGKSQSPVNLVFTKPMKSGGEIKFDYKPSKIQLVDNGHSLNINFAPGNAVSIRGEEYQLVGAHLHSGSEHTLSGQQLPLELHLVHKNKSGALAVLGIFLIEGKQKHKSLDLVFNNWPAEGGEPIQLTGVELNPIEFLPSRFTYYHYSGSLTTPPCTEGVNWNVFNTPVQVSKEQILAFRAKYPSNARPVQPLNGRNTINY